jgi:hypothetical protein
MTFTATELPAEGTVHSFTVVHYPVHPALAGSVPYAVVLVALDDHPSIRIVGNVIDCEPGEVGIGMVVEAIWQERSDQEGTVYLLQWRPAQRS